MDKKISVLKLMSIKGGAKNIAYNPKRDRFNVPHCYNTRIRKDLNANRIMINDSNIAIATQYPYQHQLEAHLQMMVDNRTPVLVILASNTDIKNDDLPKYISHSDTFGEIETSSIFIKDIELGDAIEAKIYKFAISGYKTSIDIPVIHVHNWPDHKTVSPETTANLVSLIESTSDEKKAFYEKRNSRAIHDPEKMLPVIHCKAGVGRTGQAIAALAMKRYPELNLASITKDLRASRNDFMIQTPEQMETLFIMEKHR